MLKIKEARFLFAQSKFPITKKQGFPEIAFFGRSNVGKSSFVNALINQKLARSSSTPGCTKDFNFYLVRGEFEKEFFQYAFVDVPGFGYAKFSKEDRERLSSMIVNYVGSRDELGVLVLLNDCRRMPEEDEIALRDLAARTGKHILIVLTKCDKLTRNELDKAKVQVSNAYGLEKDDLILSGTKFSLNDFWSRIKALCIQESYSPSQES